jgi:hypothetical protein
MTDLDTEITPSTTYPHANYRTIKFGRSEIRHAALTFSHNDWTKPETVCGRDWRTCNDGEFTTGEVTCKRCAAKLPKIDRERRKLEYACKRDEELDTLTAGVDASKATAWRDNWYSKLA